MYGQYLVSEDLLGLFNCSGIATAQGLKLYLSLFISPGLMPGLTPLLYGAVRFIVLRVIGPPRPVKLTLEPCDLVFDIWSFGSEFGQYTPMFREYGFGRSALVETDAAVIRFAIPQFFMLELIKSRREINDFESRSNRKT